MKVYNQDMTLWRQLLWGVDGAGLQCPWLNPSGPGRMMRIILLAALCARGASSLSESPGTVTPNPLENTIPSSLEQPGLLEPEDTRFPVGELLGDCLLRMSWPCAQKKVLVYVDKLNRQSRVSVVGDILTLVKVKQEYSPPVTEVLLSARKIEDQDTLTELLDLLLDKFLSSHVVRLTFPDSVQTSEPRSFDLEISLPSRGAVVEGRGKKGGGGGKMMKMMMKGMMMVAMGKMALMIPMGIMKAMMGGLAGMMSLAMSKMMLMGKMMKGGGGGGCKGGGGGGGGCGGGGGMPPRPPPPPPPPPMTSYGVPGSGPPPQSSYRPPPSDSYGAPTTATPMLSTDYGVPGGPGMGGFTSPGMGGGGGGAGSSAGAYSSSGGGVGGGGGGSGGGGGDGYTGGGGGWGRRYAFPVYYNDLHYSSYNPELVAQYRDDLREEEP